ncbi:MAG: hypothetical protein MRY83_18900 [Flavobacteriales bacterium]|nr:hypothetical protein [Flavobacteriales bacterium]
MKTNSILLIASMVAILGCTKRKEIEIDTISYSDRSTCSNGTVTYALDLDIRDKHDELRHELVIIDFGDGKALIETDQLEYTYYYDNPGEYIVNVRLENKKHEDEDTIHVHIQEPSLNRETTGSFTTQARYTYHDEGTTQTTDTNGNLVIGPPFEYFTETIQLNPQVGSCDIIEIESLFLNYNKIGALKSKITLDLTSNLNNDQSKHFINDSLFYSFGSSFGTDKSDFGTNSEWSNGQTAMQHTVGIKLIILNEKKNNERVFEFEFFK